MRLGFTVSISNDLWNVVPPTVTFAFQMPVGAALFYTGAPADGYETGSLAVYVSTDADASGWVYGGNLRGPQGDWLIDGDEKVRLVGREGAGDRAQIDEVIGIARNFIALTDPASLRLASIELVDRPPGGLPTHLTEAAAGLDWLAVTSPDFRLYSTPKRDGNAPPLFRALLGVDRVKHEVGLALIHEAGTAPTMLETTLLVHLQDQHAVGGYVVPRAIHVYRIDPQSRPWRFEEKPRSELTLRDTGLDLAPRLAPADFEP